MKKPPTTFNIDADGTIFTHEFPKIGKSIGAEKVLKRLTDNGHKLIIFTMRSDRKTNAPTNDETILDVTGNFLTDVVNWYKKNNIPVYGIQSDPNQHNWTTSPKSYAHKMIDDTGVGCPLKFDPEISDRPFVDWDKVEKILEEENYI